MYVCDLLCVYTMMGDVVVHKMKVVQAHRWLFNPRSMSLWDYCIESLAVVSEQQSHIVPLFLVHVECGMMDVGYTLVIIWQYSREN